MNQRSPEPIGRVVAGKYAIEAVLGHGGMGAVYRARHLALDEAVAIKILHTDLRTDRTFVTRFQTEARAAARLHHPCSVRVTDFGEEPDGLLYIVMELIEGRDLARVLESEWPLAPERVARLISQTLAALGAAHDAGIIHRDLKPENVMVVAGFDEDNRPADFVKVCDFGIAKDSRARRAPGARPAALTTSGFVVGTPAYMSPEQGRGKPLDARSDLYSVGVVLYELLTGRVPFESDDVIGVVVKHTTDEPIAPSKIVRVHPLLEAVCLKALEKDPADRFENARAMQIALRPLAGTHNVTPTRTRAPSEVKLADAPPPSRVPTQQATVTNVGPRADAPVSRAARVLRAAVVVALAAMTGAIGFRVAGRDTIVAASGGATASHAPPPRDEPPPTPSPTADVTRASPTGSSVVASTSASDRGLQPHRSISTSISTSTPTSTPTSTSTSTSTPTPTSTSTDVAAPLPVFDASRASVRIAGISAEGALVRDVSSAVGRALSRMTACYQNDLRASGLPKSGSGSLRIETDGAGTVTRARASVGFLPSIARCIEASVQGLRIAGVDTGEASATIALGFDIR